jgi:7-cyano-7-deazaguanine synthase in queuosine biosynthesis
VDKIIIARPSIVQDDDKQILQTTFTAEELQFKAWFRTDMGAINPSSEPFIPIALIPAMRQNWNMRVDSPVSSELLEGVDKIQRVMSSWYSTFNHVSIDAQTKTNEPHDATDAVAAFFSGGVDSFYSLQKHRDEITHLIFVHGFDISFDDISRREEMAANARTVAQKLQLQLVEVETNMREFGNGRVSWPNAYHGAGMGAVALLLAPRFKRIYIPSSYSLEHMFPYGSHPELDTHWSNGQVEIVHDGVEYDRFEKIQAIMDWPIITDHLRICYQSHHQGLNCGHCVKCLWTMIVLESLDRLDKINTLPNKIDLEALRQYPPRKKDQRDRFSKSIALLEASGTNTDLQKVLRELLDKKDGDDKDTRVRQLWMKIVKYLR